MGIRLANFIVKGLQGRGETTEFIDAKSVGLPILALVLFIGLFAGILISLEVGYRIGRRSSKRNPERGFEGLGAMEAAIFSLLGLLLAFSFSGATSRFDAR